MQGKAHLSIIYAIVVYTIPWLSLLRDDVCLLFYNSQSIISMEVQ